VSGKSIAILVLAGILGCGGYVVVCLIWPWANCRKCKGKARFMSWWGHGKAWRLCRKCKGTGSRPRLGIWLWAKLVQLRKGAVG
jgi:hypothetical protein